MPTEFLFIFFNLFAKSPFAEGDGNAGVCAATDGLATGVRAGDGIATAGGDTVRGRVGDGRAVPGRPRDSVATARGDAAGTAVLYIPEGCVLVGPQNARFFIFSDRLLTISHAMH